MAETRQGRHGETMVPRGRGNRPMSKGSELEGLSARLCATSAYHARRRSPLPNTVLQEASSMAKPAPPHAVVLGDARITINAIPAQVFEALTNPERLVEWWGDDVRVDAQIGGGDETTLSNRRLEATITTIQGPPKLSFAWPLSQEDRDLVTKVGDGLYPERPQTAAHVRHHSPETVAGGWGCLGQEGTGL